MDSLDPYDADLAAIQRRQRLAALLMQQGMDTSPVYSPWQGLSRVVASIMGNMQGGDADREEKALAQRRASERQSELSRVFDVAASTEPGAKMQLARMLAASADPAFQQAGLAMALKGNDEEFGTTPVVSGGQQYLVGKRGTIRPTGLSADPKYHTVGNALVPEPGAPGSSVTPAYQGPSREVTDFTELLKSAGIDPGSPQGKQLFQAYAMKQATHAPPTQVNVDTTNKPFATGIGEGLAKDFNAARAAAMGAQRGNQVADQAESLLNSGVFSGAGATITLKGGKILQTAGLGKFVDAERIANTEALISNLAQQTLANLRQSGLGGGNGFSNADRDFLEKATGGSIEMNEASLRKLITLNRRSNNNILKNFDAQAAELERRPEFKGIPLRLGIGASSPTASTPSIDDLVNKYAH